MVVEIASQLAGKDRPGCSLFLLPPPSLFICSHDRDYSKLLTSPLCVDIETKIIQKKKNSQPQDVVSLITAHST